MAEITRSPRAEADVLLIGRHIAKESQSRETALRFLDKIDEKIQFLAGQPLAGEARPDLAEGVRVFPVGNYLVFYRPVGNGIQVLRVLHGSRDIPRVFRTGGN